MPGGARPLPVRRPDEPTARPSRYGKWRAATLGGVYLLMGLHIAHWKIAGKTLAPLELNEVMHTLELGIITAGFLFMLTACVATLIFGRFFCGWGCHILALEDLCTWLLRKLRVRPRPVRSRLLLIVPAAAMFYMFFWPQVSRVAAGQPLPEFRMQVDEDGWASFQTSNFWRNLPGPGVTILTFAVCGFAIVYLVGSRSFCTYVCPYGAVFRGLDRLSPGRIIATGDCADCGICTAVCPSQVIVHEELQRFGTVVNSACVKDLECVSACPNGAVRYGLGRPPLLRGWKAWRPLRRPFDFTLAEDALMALALVAALFAFRGLYDLMPFLLTLALGVILGFCAVCVLRLVYRRDVRLSNIWLRRAGRLTWPGVTALALVPPLLALWAHSGFVRYHEFVGYRAACVTSSSSAAPQDAAFTAAIEHLDTCYRWGLVASPRLTSTLGQLYGLRGEKRGDAGDLRGAVADLARAAELLPNAAPIRYNLGVMLTALGCESEAIAQYRLAVTLDPSDADIFNNFGFLLARRNQVKEAENCFEQALRLDPGHADAHFNLSRLLSATDRADRAAAHLAAAARLDPRYAAIRSELAAP